MARVKRTAGKVLAPLASQLDPRHPDFWHPRYYCKHTLIKPKAGGKAPLILNNSQEILADAIWDCMRSGKWLLHVKARREGASTLLSSVLMQHVMFRTGFTAAILSHKMKGSLRAVNEMCRRQWDSIPPHLQPYLPAGKTIDLTFPGIDSRVLLASAREQEPLRGETVNLMFADEISSYPGHGEVWAAALSAVPEPEHGGMVFAASTPKHYGDELHKLVRVADNPGNPWHLVFIPWTAIEEYRIQPPVGWRPMSEVREYMDRFRITDAQGYWMEQRGLPTVRYDMIKFLAEYPPDLVSCFVRPGSTVFNSDALMEMLAAMPADDAYGRTIKTMLTIIHYAQPGHVYAIGVDPASSSGADDLWGLVVMDLTDGKEAAELGDKIHTAILAAIVVWLSDYYNGARVYAEANGVGDALLSHLTSPRGEMDGELMRRLFSAEALAVLGNKAPKDGRLYPTTVQSRRLYYRRPFDGRPSPGWWSNTPNKALAQSHLQELIRDRQWVLGTRRIISQLLGYQGAWVSGARDEEGGHFDLVAALAIVAWAVVHDAYELRAPLVLTVVAQEALPLVDAVVKNILHPQPVRSDGRWGDHR